MAEAKNVDNPPRVLLEDVTSFLSKHVDDKDRPASLEERTDCAIILLQSLPCARYAVLEKIGEVFFDEAQQYIVEMERHQLAGLPAVNEHVVTKRDIQIRKIQQVLVASVEANSKAWAPMIFQWAVQTLSQICGQYGTKRHFSSMSLPERFQLWLNCTGTNVLLEITICCLHKICAFAEILPYRLLNLALEMFSLHSRKAEVVIETMLSIFQLIYPTKGGLITESLFRLYQENMIDVVDKKKTESRTVLCMVPFMLHICIKSIDLFLPLVDKLLDSLSHDYLKILYEQSTKREDVLQRGMLRRTVECIKMINQSGYKLLQFLLKHACREDAELCQENINLAKSMQTICSLLLELLKLHLKTNVYVYSHHIKYPTKKQAKEEPTKTAFLTSLSLYTKQLCQQMLAATGIKKVILEEFIILLAIQEGSEKMKEVLSFILLNSDVNLSKTCLSRCIEEFKLDRPNILEKAVEKMFKTIRSQTDGYSMSQIKTLFKNLSELIEEEKDGSAEMIPVESHVKLYVNEMSQVLMLSDLGDASMVTLKLLQILCMSDLRISEYAVIAQATLHCYFNCMNRMKKFENKEDLEILCMQLKRCDDLLVNVVNEYKGIQQFVIRLLIEGILRKEEESFATEPEEPLIKVELLKKNYSVVQGNHFNSNLTSIMFKDGLKLHKRKSENTDLPKKQYMQQFFLNTLSNLVSVSTGFGPSKSVDYEMKENSFTSTWAEKTFTRMFPSAYAYTATLLVELVCPEIIPTMTWPDEDFLKYTIERDLKVKNTFKCEPVLWDILDLVSTARPSLYHCSVLVQSLFGMSLKFWQTNRSVSSTNSPVELDTVRKLFFIMKQAGWLPSEIDSISDIFHMIRPKEVYEILSAVWNYLKVTNFAPDRFIDRDQLGRPQLATNTENLQNVRSVIKVVFLRNIAKLGFVYHRFLRDNPS